MEHGNEEAGSDIDARSQAVRRIFSQVPATYERTNRVLTLGLDLGWRRRLVRTAVAGGGAQWADLCTGTGETAAALVAHAPAGTTVHAVDFSEPMLEVARRKPEASRIHFVVADIGSLPFEKGSMDLLTMSFATRNINLDRAILVRRFAEFCRVLKPGGRFVSVETSQPPSSVVRWVRNLYVRLLVKAIGSRISGVGSPYAYLASTIQSFHGAEELAAIMREAGFGSVTFQRLSLGAVAIHTAVK